MVSYLFVKKDFVDGVQGDFLFGEEYFKKWQPFPHSAPFLTSKLNLRCHPHVFQEENTEDDTDWQVKGVSMNRVYFGELNQLRDCSSKSPF